MKISYIAVAATALLMSACASGPKEGASGDTNAIYPTHLSSPTEVNTADLKDEKFLKSWIKEVGGGYDDFKKVTIPAYTVEFVTFSQDVNQNKLTTAFVKADGAKNILDMKVTLPLDAHQEMAKQIANESMTRFKEKLKKAGIELVEWSEVKKQSEDAREFETDKMKMHTFQNSDTRTSVAANGAGRLDSIFWNMSAASTVRDTKTLIMIPHFTIGYGYYGGKEMASTIKEAHGPTSLQFTPQLQVYSGSGLKMSGKYEGGNITLDKTLVSNDKFYKNITKAGDNRSLAKADEENQKAMAAGIRNTTSDNIVLSSRAGVGYQFDIDPAQYKAAVLKQLDVAENIVIEGYKKEL